MVNEVNKLTNLEKMNELVSDNADIDTVSRWAYMNRILVSCLDMEEEFETMKNSVETFVNSDMYSDDEHENWRKFLECEYVE